MEKKQVLTVTLSQEELFVILKHLRLTGMMGLDGNIFEGLPTDHGRLALSVAERSLIARTYLRPNEDEQLHLDKTILAIAVTCAVPEQSLIITRQEPGKGAEPFFFHRRRDMVTVHTIPVSAIHQFAVLKDRQALAQVALSTLALPDYGATSLTPGKLLESYVRAARDAAQSDGTAAAISLLQQTELEPATAGRLARTLANPVAITTLVFIEHRPEGISPTDGFTVLEGKEILWLLRPDAAPESEVVNLQPVSTQDVINEYKSLIPWV